MTDLLSSPTFYAAAIPAVMLVGFSKGGFGGALGILGVPLLALSIPPVRAAAILLPILVLMDISSLWAWRGVKRDRTTFRNMLPGALVGIAIGWLTAAVVTEAMVKLIVGVVALIFAARWAWKKVFGRDVPTEHNAVAGTFWGTLSGFTSFVAHAGGPPYQVYTLSLHQHPRLYTSTSVLFFAILNAIKLVPYYALGELDTTNLMTSAALMPVAIVSTLAGAAFVHRVRQELFYALTYIMMVMVAGKLIFDAVAKALGS